MTHRFIAGLALWALAPAAALVAQEDGPAGAVPVELLQARQADFLERLGSRVAVLGAAHLRDIEGDYPQDSDFRQDNNFFYLTGLERPGAWLLADGRAGHLTLYLPERDQASEVWTGPRLGPGDEARQRTGVAQVRAAARFPDDLVDVLTTSPDGGGDGSAHVLFSPGDRRNTEMIAGALERLGAETDARELGRLMAEMRLVKDDDELRRLREAIAITSDAQLEAWRLLEPGLYEYEIEAAIEYVFRARGAERVGFPSIVGSGPNSTVLHYDRSRRRMEEGDLLVLDVGAEYGYYTADLTRTVPVSGRFTPRQRALYELVLGAQEAALERVAPGRTMGELTGVARAYLDRHSGDLCGGQSCSRYFVHGLSHWLGMDVHDVGDYGTTFAPGMVFTVEPGVYLPDEGLGIRIEDDVLVTEDGYRLLSADLPRDPDDIETIMAESPRWTRPVRR